MVITAIIMAILASLPLYYGMCKNMGKSVKKSNKNDTKKITQKHKNNLVDIWQHLAQSALAAFLTDSACKSSAISTLNVAFIVDSSSYNHGISRIIECSVKNQWIQDVISTIKGRRSSYELYPAVSIIEYNRFGAHLLVCFVSFLRIKRCIQIFHQLCIKLYRC